MRFINYYTVVSKVCEIKKYMWISRDEYIRLTKHIFNLFSSCANNYFNFPKLLLRSAKIFLFKKTYCDTCRTALLQIKKDAKRRNERRLTAFHPVPRSGNFRYERSESGNRASSEHPSDADAFCMICKKTYCGGRVRAPKSESLM